jgi:hypothetical protein
MLSTLGVLPLCCCLALLGEAAAAAVMPAGPWSSKDMMTLRRPTCATPQGQQLNGTGTPTTINQEHRLVPQPNMCAT